MKTPKLIARRIINFLARTLTSIVCDIEAEGLTRIPERGPIIVIVNHVNFLELPIIYPRVKSDLGTGFSKVENWDNWLYRLLFRNWDVIPLERERVDVSAIRKGLEALENDRVLFVTPEGTRSHHGRLQKAKPGVVMLADRTQVPVWPIACYGGEAFADNIRRLKRTEYHVDVGDPFVVETNGTRAKGTVRQEIVDEMMYQIAALLPPAYRGYYSDLGAATEKYLRFQAPYQSNLKRAQDKNESS